MIRSDLRPALHEFLSISQLRAVILAGWMWAAVSPVGYSVIFDATTQPARSQPAPTPPARVKGQQLERTVLPVVRFA